jgi:ElaB/YqjD/DUF883 family membrane-anchored ribosome-binding protein
MSSPTNPQVDQIRREVQQQVDELKRTIEQIQQQSLKTMQEAIDAAFRNQIGH